MALGIVTFLDLLLNSLTQLNSIKPCLLTTKHQLPLKLSLCPYVFRTVA